MFEQIQQNLLEFIHFHEICHKFFYQDLSNTISSPTAIVSIASLQQLLPYYPQLRIKLEETLQQSKLLCETNVHCLGKISVLQQEKQELSEAYELRIRQLEEQIDSLTHALDHQKTLQSNYSQFASLHGYWKAILNHTMLSSTSPIQGKDKTDHRTMHLQTELSKQQITEMENTCAKLLNWLAIDSYQSLKSDETLLRNQHSPHLSRSTSFQNLASSNPSKSFLGTSSYDSLSNPLVVSHLHPPSNLSSESIVVDHEYLSSFKEWTNQMIRQVKKVKDSCYRLVVTIQQDQQEKQELQLHLKESKQQKHRLYEKYLEIEKDNERLQMKNEELRMIAHNNREKVYHHDQQLRQLFEILQLQRNHLQGSIDHHLDGMDGTHSVGSSLPTTPRSGGYRHPAASPLHTMRAHESTSGLPSSSVDPTVTKTFPSMINTQPVSVSRPLRRSQSDIGSRSPSPQRLAISRTMTTPMSTTSQQPLRSYSMDQTISNGMNDHAKALQQALQQLSQEKGLTDEPVLTNLSLLSTTSPSRSERSNQNSHYSQGVLDNSILRRRVFGLPKDEQIMSNSNTPLDVDQSLTYSFSSTEDKPSQLVHHTSLGEPFGRIESDDTDDRRGRTGSSNTSVATTDAIDVTLPSTISYRSYGESVASSISSHRRKEMNTSTTTNSSKLPLLPIEIQHHREQFFQLPLSTPVEKNRVLHASRSFTAPPLFFPSQSNDEVITLEALAKL